MLTNATHSIDLALSLAGPVSRVQAMTATTTLHQMEAEDFATAGLTFANGTPGTLVASTAMYPHRTEVIRLHYEHASLRIDKHALEVDWRDGRKTRDGTDAPMVEDQALSGGKHIWHQRVIEDFVHAITADTAPLVSGRTALASHRLIDAIERSSAIGAAVDV